MTGDIALWHQDRAAGGGDTDAVSAAAVGFCKTESPKIQRSTEAAVFIHVRVGIRPRDYHPCVGEHPGSALESTVSKSQAGQIYCSTSGRDDMRPNLLQCYDVTGLSGAHRNSPEDCDSKGS